MSDHAWLRSWDFFIFNYILRSHFGVKVFDTNSNVKNRFSWVAKKQKKLGLIWIVLPNMANTTQLVKVQRLNTIQASPLDMYQMLKLVKANTIHFRTLEGYQVVTFEPEATTKRALQHIGSPTCIIVWSSADSTQGNNILFFIIMW